MNNVRTQRRSAGGAIVALVLVIIAVVAIGGGYWLLFSGNSVPAGAPVALTISDGASTGQIAGALQTAGIINNPLVFRVRARFANADGKLKPGQYQLKPGTGYDSLIELLEKGPVTNTVRVTIPEGKTITQTAALLAAKLDFQAEDFANAAKTGATAYADRYPFLAGAYKDSLEGFLFPDTYEFDVKARPDDVISTMLKRFSDVWTELGEPTGEATKLSGPAQLVTVASMVEREVSVAKERPLVASVIYNRLDSDMRLELCSTVQFLLPGKEKSKLRLTNDDLQIESPYNTYRNKGLPPGPISNPGRAALEAAVHPKGTKYLYFVLTGKDGSQTFSRTLAEHTQAKNKSKQVFGQ